MASVDNHLDTVDGMYVSFNSASLGLTVEGIIDFQNKKLFF